MRRYGYGTRAVITAGLVMALGAVAPSTDGALLPHTASEPATIVACRSAYAEEGLLRTSQQGPTVYVDQSAPNPDDGVYATLAKAIDALPGEGGTVELRSDDVLRVSSVYVDKDVDLNLAGHTISSNYLASMTVAPGKNLALDGGGTVQNAHSHVILVFGTLTVKNAALELERPGTAVRLEGEAEPKLIMTGGSITAKDGDAIRADVGTVEMSGGRLSSPVRPSWCASGYAPRVAKRGDPSAGYTVGVATPVPDAIDRIYDGTEQFGADASRAYELRGGGTTVGSYTTTLSLRDGYAWSSLATQGEDDTDPDKLKAVNEAGAADQALDWTMRARGLEPSMADAEDQTYDGEEKRPVVVTCDGTTLSEGTDYTIDYRDNVDAGTAGYELRGTGNYAGAVQGEFAIAPAQIAQATFDPIPEQEHTGEAITPAPSGRFGQAELERDKDYTVAYHDNTDVGTARVTIAGIGNYTGSQELTFSIVGTDEVPQDPDDTPEYPEGTPEGPGDTTEGPGDTTEDPEGTPEGSGDEDDTPQVPGGTSTVTPSGGATSTPTRTSSTSFSPTKTSSQITPRTTTTSTPSTYKRGTATTTSSAKATSLPNTGDASVAAHGAGLLAAASLVAARLVRGRVRRG